MNYDDMDLNMNKHGFIHTLPSGSYIYNDNGAEAGVVLACDNIFCPS